MNMRFILEKNCKMDHIQRAKKIIEENRYLVIASSSLDGEPWISPVFFASDEKYNLYWVSNKNSKHSDLIRKNPKVAIVIFNSSVIEGEGTGVYFEAEVTELKNKEDIEKAMKELDKRVMREEFKVKKIEDVLDFATWRIYKASPKKVSVLTQGEYINGQLVDKRVEIPIEIR
jgi:uncharacterized protein YhbP (UPF0306 family)